MIPSMGRNGRGFYSPEVAPIATAINSGIAVQDFSPETSPGNADAVILPRDRGEVADHEKDISFAFPPAEKDSDTILPIAKVNPLESFVGKIKLMESWFCPVKTVQVSNPLLHSLLGRSLLGKSWATSFFRALFCSPPRDFSSPLAKT